MSISSEELNLLVLRFLEESGFTHTAFSFQNETQILKSNFAKTELPPGTLVSLIKRGLQFLEIESDLSAQSHKTPVAPSNSKRANSNSKTSVKKRPKVTENSTEIIRTEISHDLLTFKGHTSEVFSCFWNPVFPDLIASGATDATICLWKRDVQNPIAVLKHLNSDFLNTSSIKRRWRFKNKRKGALADVTCLSWSQDGMFLGSGDSNGKLRLFTKEGKLIRTVCGHSGTIFSLQFNPSTTKIVTGSWDSKIVVWDLEEMLKPDLEKDNLVDVDLVVERLIQVVEDEESRFIFKSYPKAHQRPVLDVSWRDDEVFVSSSADHTMSIRNIITNKDLRLTGHTGEVNAVKWSPDGTKLASACDDKTSRVYSFDVRTHDAREIMKIATHVMEVFTCVWSPDSKLLATASFDSGVNIFDTTKTGARENAVHLFAEMKEHKGEVYSLAFSKNGRFLCSGSMDRRVIIFDVHKKQVLKQIMMSGNVFEVHFHPTKHEIAVCCGEPSNDVCILSFRPDSIPPTTLQNH